MVRQALHSHGASILAMTLTSHRNLQGKVLLQKPTVGYKSAGKNRLADTLPPPSRVSAIVLQQMWQADADWCDASLDVPSHATDQVKMHCACRQYGTNSDGPVSGGVEDFNAKTALQGASHM